MTIEAKYEDDHAVASEPFTIIALPAKMLAMMGEIRLWNCKSLDTVCDVGGS